jgi:thiosulfate/3-mercaptopyruvate sulfurtransferase
MSRSDVLVDADWVEAHLDDPSVAIVEVDEDTSAYEKNHIRNAIRIDWTKDLQDPVRRDFVDQEGFEKLLSARASATTPWSSSTAATTTGSRPTPTGTSSCTATTTSSCSTAAARSGSSTPASWSPRCPRAPRPTTRPRPQNTAIRAFRDDVVAAIGSQNLVDVRSPDEFSGKLLAPAHLPQEQSQRPGHVPSARNIPWSKNANDDGTFKSDDELKELYAEEQVDLAKDTIAYCRIGERSALTWFVLHELLGVENVKNYDGSWTEYGSLVGVPIELGANK